MHIFYLCVNSKTFVADCGRVIGLANGNDLLYGVRLSYYIMQFYYPLVIYVCFVQ